MIGWLQAQALAGVVLFPARAWAMSENRASLGLASAARIAGTTLLLQLAIALLLLNLPLARLTFQLLGDGALRRCHTFYFS